MSILKFWDRVDCPREKTAWNCGANRWEGDIKIAVNDVAPEKKKRSDDDSSKATS